MTDEEQQQPEPIVNRYELTITVEAEVIKAADIKADEEEEAR